MNLENIIEKIRGVFTKERTYSSNDLESLSSIKLYMDEKIKNLKTIDLPYSGVSLHMHLDAQGNILESGYKKDGEEHQFLKINSEQAAMADYYGNQLDLHTTNINCLPQKESNSLNNQQNSENLNNNSGSVIPLRNSMGYLHESRS